MTRRRLSALATAVALVVIPVSTTAHAPSVQEVTTPSPGDAVVLDDPTLSRAIGALISTPGETDWYRMDLQAGEPLVVGMTAPDAAGAVAATFTLLGPGLPDADLSGAEAAGLAEISGASGAVVFQPATDPAREVHGGLGFINYGTLRLEAPETGSYLVAVSAVDDGETGKYVIAPGVREEFGLDAFGGMADLIRFFNQPWPPSDADSGTSQ